MVLLLSVPARNPFALAASTWSFISEISGLTTTLTPFFIWAGEVKNGSGLYFYCAFHGDGVVNYQHVQKRDKLTVDP